MMKKGNNKAALRLAGVFLIGIAVVGKLALLNLRGSSPLETLVVVGSSGSELRDTLRALEAEQGALKSQLSAVQLARQRQAQLAAARNEARVEEEERLASLSSELMQQAKQRDEMLSQLSRLRGKGTRKDEGLVQLVERAEMDKSRLKKVEVKLQAEQEERGVERRTKADVVADKELQSQGIVAIGGAMGDAMATSEQVKEAGAATSKAEAAKKANERLEASNKELQERIASEERALHATRELYGSKALAAAGVVTSSWGPLIATAGTKADPRDSFAVSDAGVAKLAADPHKAADQAHAAKASGPPMTEADLERDLGFKASILDSNTFKQVW